MEFTVRAGVVVTCSRARRCLSSSGSERQRLAAARFCAFNVRARKNWLFTRYSMEVQLSSQLLQTQNVCESLFMFICREDRRIYVKTWTVTMKIFLGAVRSSLLIFISWSINHFQCKKIVWNGRIRANSRQLVVNPFKIWTWFTSNVARRAGIIHCTTAPAKRFMKEQLVSLNWRVLCLITAAVFAYADLCFAVCRWLGQV